MSMDRCEIVVPRASGEAVFGHSPKNRPLGLEEEVRTESGIIIVVGGNND